MWRHAMPHIYSILIEWVRTIQAVSIKRALGIANTLSWNDDCYILVQIRNFKLQMVLISFVFHALK